MNYKLSLRFLFPGALLAAGLMSATIASYQDYIEHRRNNLAQLQQRVLSTCHLMTTDLERAVREDNLTLIQQHLLNAGLIPEILNACLYDPSNKLLFCSRDSEAGSLGDPLSNQLVSNKTAAVRTRLTATTILESESGLVYAIAPILFNSIKTNANIKEVGLLILQADQNVDAHLNLQKLIRDTIVTFLLLGSISVAISSLLTLILASDLRSLLSLVRSYTAGTYRQLPTSLWTRELTVVSKSIESMLRDLSAREANLKNSESRFRELFDSSAYGALLISRSGQILAANKTICAMLGVDEHDVIAHGIVDLTTASIEQLNGYKIQVEQHGRVTFEVEFVCRNRSRVWTEVKVQKLTGKASNDFLASIRDIRKRIELAAKERDELIDQKLMTLISSMGIEARDLKQFEARLLATLGTRLKVSRAYIFTHNYDANTMDNTAEWVDSYISPQLDELQNLPFGEHQWWMNQLLQGNTIEYSDIEKLPDESTRQLLKQQEIKAILVMPLYLGNRYRGFLGLDHCISTHHWTDREKNLLAGAQRVLLGVWADDELRRSNSRLRDMLAKMESIAVTTTDANGTLSYWNSAAEKFYGYSATEALGKNVNELLGALEERSQQDSAFGQLDACDNLIRPREQVLSRKDGSSLYVNSYWSVSRLPGEPVEIFRFDTDLSEIRAAQLKERQLASALEQTTIGILITDTKGHVVYVNQTFQRTTGYTLDEVIGKNPRFLKSGKNPRELYNELWTSLKSGKDWNGQLLNRRKDGTLYWELNHISPIFDADGRIQNYLAIKEDISERIKAEEESEKMQAQLMQAQKMETVGRFAGGIAHDFNNMLNVILGYTELCIDQLEESHPVSALLSEVRTAANRSTSLTRQLLAFSRKQTLQSEAISLNELLAGMEQMIRRLIGENIEINLNLSTHVGTIVADRGQLEQVLLNLVVNARDAMPGGGRLTLETTEYYVDDNFMGSHVSMKPGRYTRLSISDTGVGMDTETIQHIFDPFFTTKAVGEGTGLGLSTVYAVINNLGGNIHVYSEPTHGTTFHVYFPLSDSSPSVLHVEETGDVRCAGETIFVVEDEVSLQQLIVRLLSNAGYNVLTTSDPSSALRIFEQNMTEIDLLLTDVIMPVMNGAELSARLTEMKPNLKVLYMSGYTDAIISQHGVHTSRHHFINKPFTAVGLLKKLSKVLHTANHVNTN